MTNLLNAAKAALEALETCDWNDNDFPDDTQYFDRFAVSEAATKLRAAIAEAEKQEPVLYMDNRTDVVSPALRHTRKGYDTPLYLHPAPTMSEWQPIETAPKDNKVPLFLARFNEDGTIQSFDYDGIWESDYESWEMPQVYYFWASANGNVEEPTHWMLQPEWFVRIAAAPKPENKS